MNKTTFDANQRDPANYRLRTLDGAAWSGMGPVPQPVFKTGEVV